MKQDFRSENPEGSNHPMSERIPEPRPLWRVQLLGGLSVAGPSCVFTRFRTRKTGALLAYLAFFSTRAHPRDHLVEMFWPDVGVREGRLSLNMAVFNLRQQLDIPGPIGRAILSDRDTIRINTAVVGSDVAEFEATWRVAASATSEDIRMENLLTAVQIYNGELLPGFYEDWIGPEQSRLAEFFIRACGLLTDLLVEDGQADRAMDIAWRAANVNPTCDEPQVRLIQLLVSSGQPAAALRRFEELERILARDYEAQPSLAIQELAREIRATVANTVRSAPHHGQPSDPAQKRMTLACPEDRALRVAIMCRRAAESDAERAHALAAQLRAAGHIVFLDNHAELTVSRAQQIEREIRLSDVVAPLLSPASITSEMLAYQIQIARDEAAISGRPQLAPVLLDGLDMLPESLAGAFEPDDYLAWRGDAGQFSKELIAAIRRRSPVATQRARLETVGGAVPIGSNYYVDRVQDSRLQLALDQCEMIVLIKGARQIGKSSLLIRGLAHARQAGARVALIDLSAFSNRDLESQSAFLLALAGKIADRLELDLNGHWEIRRDPARVFERFMRWALHTSPVPLVWGIDQADRLFDREFGGDFFAMLRSWFNARSFAPDGVWTGLTLAMAYASEAHLLIRDVNLSPFNVGVGVALDRFTRAESDTLNRLYGSPLKQEIESERLYKLLGGQPYLTRLALNALTSGQTDLENLEAAGKSDDGLFSDHLRRLLSVLATDPELCGEVLRALHNKPCRSLDLFYRLRSAGVLAGASSQEPAIPCLLYKAFLQRHL